ncbi:Tetratricopeptide repeat protein 38 [Triticum urartu]|uniref:Tetratricopeptide repeat protein 38 n=1 Tax=Triticum urartu TaxID=4572 RepID=M7ZVH5_TRIUA|nr:Tetratricopeptide repeat protein 38 [Triticum urartu]
MDGIMEGLQIAGDEVSFSTSFIISRFKSDFTRKSSLSLFLLPIGKATGYERAVFRALSALLGEDRDTEVAIDRHFQLLKEFPRDLMSLKRAQLLCFYVGRPDTSLKFVQQVLPENQDRNYIYGMLAFPLLELGRMDEAEIAARKGLAINKNDFWFTHNWWHVAVCYLEAEAPISKVMEVYDQNIMKELDRSDCEPAEVYVNALGLLLRLYVRGEIGPAKEKLTPLLDELKNESIWHAEWLLDLLILWALSSMNEIKAAENLLDSLRSRVSSMDTKRQQVMHKAIQLADAVYKYGKGEHKAVFDTLGPDFDGLSYKEKAYAVEGRGADASVAAEKANALQAAQFH